MELPKIMLVDDDPDVTLMLTKKDAGEQGRIIGNYYMMSKSVSVNTLIKQIESMLQNNTSKTTNENNFKE